MQYHSPYRLQHDSTIDVRVVAVGEMRIDRGKMTSCIGFRRLKLRLYRTCSGEEFSMKLCLLVAISGLGTLGMS